jgi:hypothetical protein
MFPKRALTLVVSYVMASQYVYAPAAWAGTPDAVKNLNNMLSAIAAHNGMTAINTSAPHNVSSIPMPTKSDVVNAIRNLPAPVDYSHGEPIPTPTVEEAATLVAPEADFFEGVNLINVYNPNTGTVTQADESLTGLFDDLANIDMTQFEPEVDPTMFDPDPNAGATTVIDSPIANLTDTLAQPQSTNLLTSTIGLDSTGTQLEVQISQPIAISTEYGGINESALGVLTLPSMLCTPDAEPFVGTALSSALVGAALLRRPQGILLQGFVDQSDDLPYFVNPTDRDTTLALPDGHSLTVARNGLAWLESCGDFIKVRAGSAGVSMSAANGQRIVMHAGEEALWAAAGVDGAAQLADGLAKRRVAHHELADGSSLYLCEFSIPHFLAKEESTQGMSAAAIRERLLKSAAAISIACRHHGRYRALRTIASTR